MGTINFDGKAASWDTPEKIARAKIFADKIISETAAGVGSVLEYGAGTGLVSFWLTKQFKHITLGDSSAGMLGQAQKKIEQLEVDNMAVKQLDLAHENINQQFEVIYSLLTMHHVKDVGQMFKQFYNCQPAGGKLLIADLDSEDGSFHGLEVDVHHGFDREHIVALAQAAGYRDITIETLTEIKRDDRQRSYPVFVISATR